MDTDCKPLKKTIGNSLNPSKLRRSRSWNGSKAGMTSETDDRGWTPLHVACRVGDMHKVVQLLAAGADVNVTSRGPKTPGATPLHLAATGGHVDVMGFLLECGANLEARIKGGCGWTPLHVAAKEKKKRAMRFLIDSGAFLPPDIADTRFNPPLQYCSGLEYAYNHYYKVECISSSSCSVS